MHILITCPPMLGKIEDLRHLFDQRKVEIFCPAMVQTLSEEELVRLVPQFDGWIIGDDPATRAVFEAGKKGLLKAAVKWGVGVDNVDFAAANDCTIPVTNTPNMFGGEVGDVAMSYVAALARETFLIDREVRAGRWPKPNGISLAGKILGLVGLGDIGKATARRALAADMKVIAYDPIARPSGETHAVEVATWPERIEECDFLVLTCSLNQANRHMLNRGMFARAKKGVRIVNVARGALISERDLIEALEDGTVHSAALDVFETEPLPIASPLRKFERCILGSHNGSNTADAVMRTSERAVGLLFGFLEVR